jgi:transposase InsO family protein
MRSQHYAVRQICRALRGSRSSHYDQARGRDATSLKAAIERLAGAWPTYGDRRITALLRREGFQVNLQHTARRMREMDLQGHRPARRPRTTQSAHAYPRDPNLMQGVTIGRPDPVWVGDITDVRLHQGGVSLAVLMDVYTRGHSAPDPKRDGEQARWVLTADRRTHGIPRCTAAPSPRRCNWRNVGSRTRAPGRCQA